MPPRIRATRSSPRVKAGKAAPVTVRKIQPQTLVDIGHISTEALPLQDIPPHMRSVHPVAASVAYRLADGKWNRVEVAEDGRSVMVR